MKRIAFILGLLGVVALGIGSNAQDVGRVVDQILATTCTNQLVRSIAASGAGTCASVATGDVTANAVTNALLAQMANATTKCRTTAGTGNPEDCSATQLATILNAVGGAVKSAYIATSYDLTTASGSQVVTGAGFQPTFAIALSAVNSSTVHTVGLIASANTQGSVLTLTDGTIGALFSSNQTKLFHITNSAGTAVQSCTAALSSDGVTCTWVKTGAPTGTLQQFFLFVR